MSKVSSSLPYASHGGQQSPQNSHQAPITAPSTTQNAYRFTLNLKGKSYDCGTRPPTAGSNACSLKFAFTINLPTTFRCFLSNFPIECRYNLFQQLALTEFNWRIIAP